MVWKEFLKPDLRKVFIVLIIYSFVMTTYYLYYGPNYYNTQSTAWTTLGVCATGYYNCVESVHNKTDLNISEIDRDFSYYQAFYNETFRSMPVDRFMTYPYHIGLFDIFGLFDDIGYSKGLNYPLDLWRYCFEAITLLIYWYLLSCVLVFAYDKIRKK